MLKAALLIAKKDVTVVLMRGAGVWQAVLLGLVLIFLFSLSAGVGEKPSPQQAAVIFWMSTLFCQVLIFQTLYAAEEKNDARTGLILMPVPVQSIWLGKLFAGGILLMLSQCLFIPALFVFLAQTPGASALPALASLILADLGVCACGSLLGALSAGSGGKESLLSIIVFPLLIPLLLAAIRLTAAGLAPEGTDGDSARWLGLAASFDCVFLGAGLFLFPYVYANGGGQ